MGGIEVEIEIGLHPPRMGVAGHGVPDRARLQRRHAHHQLVGAGGVGHDVLPDGALVRGFRRAQMQRVGVVLADELVRRLAMGRRAGQVELRRVGRIGAGEDDLLRAEPDIERVELRQVEALAVDGDRAGAADD